MNDYELRCSQCGAVCNTNEEMARAFGYDSRPEQPKEGDTHVCDRFEYGVLKRVRTRV